MEGTSKHVVSATKPKSLEDRVYGCLIGGAIGDALGAPVEGWSFRRIREEYGKVEEFHSYEGKLPYSSGKPGVVTDDTTLRHYLCYAIVKKGGRVTPDDYAEVWREHLNPNRLWENEAIVKRKLDNGMSPWDTGKGTIPAGVASMAIEPIGIVNVGDPERAYRDAFLIASVNQTGSNRDVAATFAAGIAEALDPEATVDSVIEAMFEHSTDLVHRAFDLTMALAEEANDIDEFASAFYDDRLDYTWPAVEWDREAYREGELFSAESLEFVPAAVAIFALCEGDVNDSIVEGASFGRDCDTIAKLAGNLAGALRGQGPIRDDWIKDCERANTPFFEELEGDSDANFRSMARRLVDVVEIERDRTRQRAKNLDRILRQ